MEKVIRDGKVAVLFSPGYGAGWSTWGLPVEAIFDPELVEAVLEKNADKALEIATTKWPDEYLGGLKDLRVGWLPEGAVFKITEYDGSESIETMEGAAWIQA